MVRTLAAAATAAAFGVGLATSVAAAPSMKAGGNFHANMGAPTVGARSNAGAMIHGSAAGPNTAIGPSMGSNTGPRPFNGNWNQSWNQRWSGNWRDHDRFRHHRRGFVGFGLYAYGPGYYDYDYDYSCYQRRLIRTPYGWRWRLVWACGPNY